MAGVGRVQQGLQAAVGGNAGRMHQAHPQHPAAEDTGTPCPAPTGFALLRCDIPEETATQLRAGHARSPAEVPSIAEETDPVAMEGVCWTVRIRLGIAARGVVKNELRTCDGHTADPVRLVRGGLSLQEGVEPSTSPRCQSFPSSP